MSTTQQEPECSMQFEDNARQSPDPQSTTNIDPEKSETSDNKTTKESQEPPPRIKFQCEKCDMNEFCDYVGTTPPFVNGLVFAEDCYVMRDPFAPPPFRSRSKPEYFIVLGAHCTICYKIVCKRPKCSIFYQKTFCGDCATANFSRFPNELQGKFSRQLAS